MARTATTAPIRTAYALPTWDAMTAKGGRHIYLSPEYAGTIARVTRQNYGYITVSVSRPESPSLPQSATIWLDTDAHGWKWVVDYYSPDAGYVTVDTTTDVLAAINVAVWSASERGHQAGWW